MKYEVVGRQPVAGHRKGSVVELDLDEEHIARLVERGQIKPVVEATTKNVADATGKREK